MFFLNSVRVAPGVRSALAVACGLALLSGSAAWAEDDGLPTVVVTPTRVPTRVSALVADVTVIDRTQIEQARGKSVASLLSFAPGVQISSTGGEGQSSSVYVRGGSSVQALLVIDGVPYNSGTSGAPSLESIPLDEVDRIEIVRGPMAALYGSGAATGVVQIFTRKGRTGFSPTASVAVGSDRYFSVASGVSGGDDRVTYSVHASTAGASGFSATNERNYYYNADRDGYTQRAVTARLGLKLNEDWRADANFMSSKGVVHFDDGYAFSGATLDANTDQSACVAGLALTGQIGSEWRTTFRVARTEDVSDTTVFNDPDFGGRFATNQVLLAWENQFSLPMAQALVAVEQLQQDVGGTSAGFAVTSRSIRSLILGLNGSVGDSDWQVSARQDNNSQFGNEATGALGYGYKFLPQWKATASIGSSFIAPSFNDLYYPQYDYGNPNLRPQHGVNKELSLGWADQGDELKLVRYDNRIRDYIQATQVSETVWRAGNVNGVRLSGWTLSGAWSEVVDAKRFYASGSLDWLDAHDVDTDLKLARRATRSAALRGGVEMGAVSYEVSVRSNNGSNDGSSKHLAGYSLWGASVGWAMSRDWKLALRADNIGNHAYQTAWNFNQPLSRYFLTLSYSPKAN